MGRPVPVDDLPTGLVPADDLPAEVPRDDPLKWTPGTSPESSARFSVTGEEAPGFWRGVARGGWSLPGLLGVDYEKAHAFENAIRDPYKLEKDGFGLMDRVRWYEAREREITRRGEEENPIKTGLGVGVGAAPSTAVLPQARAAEGAGLAARAAASAMTAGAQSAAIEGGVSAGKPLGERLKGMGVAGVSGAGLGLAAPVPAPRAPGSVVPEPIAEWLAAKAEGSAVRSTGADRTAARAAGMGKGAPNAPQKIARVGRFLLDEDVPLRSPAAMKERLGEILSEEGPQVGALAKQADATGATVNLGALRTDALRNPGVAVLGKNTETRALGDRVKAFLEDQIAQHGESVSPSVAHDIRKQLDGLSRWSQQNPPELADAFRSIRGVLDDHLGAAMDAAGLGQDWAETNARYATAATAKGLADTGAERRTGNAMFSPTEKGGGLVGAALAIGGHGPAGLALAGGTFAAKRYGAPVTARVLDKLSSALRANPQEFGDAAPKLLAAAQRGPEALAAAHYVLSLSPGSDYKVRAAQILDRTPDEQTAMNDESGGTR